MAVTKLVITNKLRNDIIERRKENALSSYELSEQSGHSKFWLQNIESGKTKRISKDDLLSIYRVLFQADSDDEILDDVEQILNQEQAENINIYEVMLEIGKKRGCIISGGNIDDEKTAKILLDEFKNGKLSRITIEKRKV